MYPSKLIFNPHNAGACGDEAKPYELHRTLKYDVEQALDDELLLFRIEPESRPGGPVVRVQSDATHIDWSPLLSNGYVLNFCDPTHFDLSLQMRPDRLVCFWSRHLAPCMVYVYVLKPNPAVPRT